MSTEHDESKYAAITHSLEWGQKVLYFFFSESGHDANQTKVEEL